MSQLKTKMITLRLSEEEQQMIQSLKLPPHYINVSEFLRNSLKELYQSRIKEDMKDEPTIQSVV